MCSIAFIWLCLQAFLTEPKKFLWGREKLFVLLKTQQQGAYSLILNSTIQKPRGYCLMLDGNMWVSSMI